MLSTFFKNLFVYVYQKESGECEGGSLAERDIRLIGNGQTPVHTYWEELLKLIQKGDIDPLKMVSHRVRLEELDKAYYKFEKKEDGMQKVFVRTRFSALSAEGSPQLTVYGK